MTNPLETLRQRNANLSTGKKLTGLAGIVGLAVASALYVATPHEESGRKVEVTLDDAGKPTIKHIRGKQYLTAYLDMVGVSTACDGLTRGEDGEPIPRGARYTEAQCTVMLERALISHATGVMKCTPGLALSPNIHVEVPREGPRFAAVSGAYNYGVSLYCGSTAAKRFNAGDYAGGCTALTRFNRAGGRVVKGLVNRRAREYNVCANGLGALKT